MLCKYLCSILGHMLGPGSSQGVCLPPARALAPKGLCLAPVEPALLFFLPTPPALGSVFVSRVPPVAVCPFFFFFFREINTKSQAKTKELTSLGNRKYEITTNKTMREADYDKAFNDLEAKKEFDKKREASPDDC